MTGEISILPPEKPRKKIGGARPGAGRKPGSKTTKTKLLAAAAAAAGITPIEVMLGNMRFYHDHAEKFTERMEIIANTMSDKDLRDPQNEKLMELLKLVNKVGDFRMKAQACAVDAAPYIHPRLTSIAVKDERGDSKRPMLDITPDLAPKVAAERYAAFLAA